MNLAPSPPAFGSSNSCPRTDNCIPGVCPDFQIKQHDTMPPFKVSVSDESGPMDLTGNYVVEANMWACAKFKKDVTDSDTSFQLADNIGFPQALVNDIIVVDRVRSPEHMKVVGFDETNKFIEVERAYNGTEASAWKRGTSMRIFRLMSATAISEMIYENIEQLDGTVLTNQLVASYLVYEWTANDTCTPGCYRFEFKLLKMTDGTIVIPSTTPLCHSGIGVDWVRRFPVCGEFLIQVCNSPTAEL